MKTQLQKSILVSFLILLCLGFSLQVSSQVNGDFRSTATGNWSTSTTWQRYNGATWDASGAGSNNPGQTPTSTNAVWIQTAHVVTLTANASCNDLHIASGTTAVSATLLGRIGLATFTLSVNGKMRSYLGTLNTIPGTSQANGYSIYPFTNTSGKVSIVGTTRTVFTTGEWGATITTPTSGAFPLEVNLNDNTQTATFSTNTKSTSFNLVTGIVLCATISNDNGTAGQGDVTIASGTTLSSSATSNNVFQRTGSSKSGTLTIAGTLRLSAGTPQFSVNSVTNTGTVEYSNTGTQTFITATNTGANMSYNNLVISGSGVKTLALATAIAGTTTVNTGCTLGTGAFTLTNNGTATINGSFRLDQGGWGGNTGTYNYASTGTLIFNNSSGLYGVNSGDTWWSTTNGPINVTVLGTGITMNVARTVPSSGTTGIFSLSTGTVNAIQGTALTLNGTLQINNGGTFQTTPTFGASSTLIYNTVTYTTNNEWTGGATSSVAAGSGIPANVQVLSGTVTLAGGRGVPGNVTVTTGGLILNATSGDLYLGGNLTHSGTTWTNNTRAVVFVGTGTSIINTSANSGVHFFDYLLVNKSSGSVQIGATTNVTLNTTAGSVLQFLNAGTLDLNGRTLTMNNNGGNILVDGTTGGTTKSIVSTTGTGTIAITNGKTASGTAGGTLSTSAAVNWILTGGMNFGGVTTVNGTLQINAGGFVTTNAPIYGSGSLLKYNSAANPFNRTTEWSASSGAGYPYNVQISNNTTVSPGGTGNTGVALNVANNLTIDSGSNLYMDYGANNMTVPLIVNNDLTITGNLSASGASGGDVIVNGNWTRTGTFGPNGRAVFFQGTNAQSVTGATTFDFLLIDKTAGSVTLNNNITASQTVTFTAPNIANFVTGSNKVIVSNTGSVTRTGSGHVNGNLQMNIPTGTNSRTFEIGDATIYTPVITAYTGVTGTGDITVSTTVLDHPQITSSNIGNAKSVNRYYSIANSGVTGGSYNPTFTFVSGDVDGGAATSNFIVSNYINPTWTNLTAGTRTSTTTQATGVTIYGDFQIGENVFTTWTAGASTTAWATSGNWSNGVPNADSKVAIASASFYPEITTTVTAYNLNVVAATSLTVKSGGNITLTDKIANAGTITIENNANLKQINATTNTGSGSTIVKRNTAALMRQDYVMWSSPVSGQQLQAFSPQTLSTRFYVYDYTVGGGVGNYAATSATANFVTGTGYLIRLPNNHPVTATIWNGQFTGGNANNGIVDPTLPATNKYYSIGNPYASTISADDFITSNSLNEAIYFWRKSNNAATSSYATYTLAGGVSNSGGDPLLMIPNGFIQVGQGFIAKLPSPATKFTFTNSLRVINNGDQFFRRLEDRSRYWLNLTNDQGFFGQMMVAYMPNATNGYDPAIDGLFFNDSATSLTSTIDNQDYVIQGRALPFEATDVVALGFKSELAGSYTIALNSFDGTIFESQNQAIYLKDNLTNTIQDLRAAPYNFATEPGVFNNRFEVRYENLLSVGNPSLTTNTVAVYKQNQEIVVNAGNIKLSTVQIYDIRGRLLVEKSNIDGSEVRLNAGTSNQVILVKITSVNNEVVTKKVVN